MKKSSKKIQLKKRSISTLNAHNVKGGIGTTTTVGTTSLLTITAKSFMQGGEDVCLSNAK